MTLLDIRGKPKKKNVEKYRIDWDAKCRSNIQFVTKQFLKAYWSTHVVYEEFPVFGTRLKVDLINFTKKVAVEVQGSQHNEYNPFFHNNRLYNFGQSIKRDTQKQEWLERNNIRLLEIHEDEIKGLSKEFFKANFNIDLP